MMKKSSTKITNSRNFTGPEVRSFCFLSTDDETKFKCLFCPDSPSTIITQSGSNYSNLVRHVQSKHEDWEELYEKQKSDFLKSNGQLKLSDFKFSYVDQRSRDVYSWISWIVQDNLPLSFCEKPSTRANTNLSHISRHSLHKYMLGVQSKLVEAIKLELKNRILGLLFDGWSDGKGNHYCALFICYEGSDGKTIYRLISVAPLLDETKFDAVTHIAYIDAMLRWYDLTLANITFLVGDNCSTNGAIGRLANVPLIGCASHRFNLAVQQFYAEYEPILFKINEVMKRLRQLKNAGKLRVITGSVNLTPKPRNVTRWSSTYNMIVRYLKIISYGQAIRTIDEDPERHPVTGEPFGLNYYLLSPVELRRINDLLPHLKTFEQITKYLQLENCPLSDVRDIFDDICGQFPILAPRLSAAADIVQVPQFENGIVKILQKRETEMTPNEKESLRPFLLPPRPVGREVVEAANNPVSSIIQQAKRLRQEDLSQSQYNNLQWIPSTSNVVERLFSKMKLVFSERRQSMEPSTLECMMMLTVNRELWNERTVNQVLKEIRVRPTNNAEERGDADGNDQLDHQDQLDATD